MAGLNHVDQRVALPAVPFATAAMHPRRQLTTPHLYVHPQHADVVCEAMADGIDYHRICPRHQHANRAVTRLDDLQPCPHCRMEVDERMGALRYRLLHSRVTGLV